MQTMNKLCVERDMFSIFKWATYLLIFTLFQASRVLAAEPEPTDSDVTTPPAHQSAIPQTLKEDSAVEEKPAPWPDKIGPFELQSNDKQHTLRLGLAMQLLFRVDNKDRGTGQSRENQSYAEARRIRPSLRGSLVNGLFEFYLHLNTSPNTLDLLDIYLNYKPHDYAQLRLGQWKIPFTRYRIQSYKRLTLADWAITSKSFGAERQIGLAIHSGLEKPQPFDYALGVFSGMNARSSHAVGIATLYGETIPSASNLAEPGPKMEFHPEFVGRFGYNYRGIDIQRDTDFKGGAPRLHAGMSASYDLRPDEALDFAARFSPEFLLKAYGFSFFASAYLGWCEETTGKKAPNLAMVGGLLQTSYLLTPHVELALRYAIVHNLKEARHDARRRADRLIASAEDPSEVDALTESYQKVGTITKEHETSFGVNVYIIGESLKWQNDISCLIHDRIEDHRQDIRFRSQLQLAF